MIQLGKFLIVLLVGIPSVTVSIIIFIYFATDREARSQTRNHGWLVLVAVFFAQVTTDLPMALSYYYHDDKIWPESYAYCVWWTWYEFSFNGIGLFMMASISIERHIHVFYPQGMLQIRWRKWLFHFLPIMICLGWPPLFYFVLVVISPLCETGWNFEQFNCGVPCYFEVDFVGLFDFIFNIVCPISLIILANVLLIVRVVYQKMSRRQAIHWRRHRKMTLQLWTISSLYLAFWLPITIVQMIQITAVPTFMLDQVETLLFMIYFVPLLLPMVCLSTLPKLVRAIAVHIQRRTLNVIAVQAVSNGPRQTMHQTTGTNVR